MKKKMILFFTLYSVSIFQLGRIMQPTNFEFLEDVLFPKQELTEWDIFIQALIEVESGGNINAVGKTQDLGILQITPIYVAEANRLSNKGFTLEDRLSKEKSLEMFNIIQEHHNPNHDIAKAIKLHNPGAGKWYADRIYKTMDNIRRAV